MYTLPLLPLFSLLLSTASALPQVVCFAGICNPVVPYNAPYYEIWAHRYYEQYLQDQENRHKNKLQDHDKNLPREIASAEPVNSTSTTAVKAEEPDEPWAGVSLRLQHPANIPRSGVDAKTLTPPLGILLRRHSLERRLQTRLLPSRQRSRYLHPARRPRFLDRSGPGVLLHPLHVRCRRHPKTSHFQAPPTSRFPRLDSTSPANTLSNALCASIMSDGSDSLTLSYPGTPDLGNTEKGDFNDRLLSYSCFREE